MPRAPARLLAWPEVVIRALLFVEHFGGQQPVVQEGVTAGIVPVGGLREGGNVADVVEDVVTEDAVRASSGILPAGGGGRRAIPGCSR